MRTWLMILTISLSLFAGLAHADSEDSGQADLSSVSQGVPKQWGPRNFNDDRAKVKEFVDGLLDDDQRMPASNTTTGNPSQNETEAAQ